MQLQWDKLIINNEVFVFCEDTGQVLPEIADIPVNIFHCEKIFFTHANVRVHLPRVPEDGGRLRGGSEARARQCPAPGPRRPGSASSPGERRSRPARTRALAWSLTRSSQTPPPTFKHATVLHNSNCKPLEQKMYNKVLSLAMVDGVSVVVWRGCRLELGSAGSGGVSWRLDQWRLHRSWVPGHQCRSYPPLRGRGRHGSAQCLLYTLHYIHTQLHFVMDQTAIITF